MGRTHEQRKGAVGLPPRPFLYTLDQISAITSIPVKTLAKTHLYYENRSIGSKEKYLISARNVAPPDTEPEWRVSETEFVRWLQTMGFKYYERGYIV